MVCYSLQCICPVFSSFNGWFNRKLFFSIPFPLRSTEDFFGILYSIFFLFFFIFIILYFVLFLSSMEIQNWTFLLRQPIMSSTFNHLSRAYWPCGSTFSFPFFFFFWKIIGLCIMIMDMHYEVGIGNLCVPTLLHFFILFYFMLVFWACKWVSRI